MLNWPAHAALETVLRDLDAHLATSPGDPEAHLLRGSVLRDLGLAREAADALETAVALAPDHAGAAVALAAALHREGERIRPLALLENVLRAHPDDAAAHVSYANLLGLEHPVRAREHLERALDLVPGLHEAHASLCSLLAMQGDLLGAATHREAAFALAPARLQPYRGARWPRSALLLVSTDGGNLAAGAILDDTRFQTTNLYVEAFEPGTPLPPHEIVVNGIADADRNGRALERAQAILRATSARVINPPERVAGTGRAEIARRLRRIGGVRTPAVARYDPSAMPPFPFLLRAPGFHMGRHFALVTGRSALDAAITSFPPVAPLTIEFVDTADRDGWFWKYRVMSIGGQLFPLHLAASREWKVHYFSSAMFDAEPLRMKERAFLEDMPRALGASAVDAIEAIARELQLDYAGIDFTLDRNGDVVVFEANAAMAVLPPDPDPRFAYRIASARRVLNAIAGLTA